MNPIRLYGFIFLATTLIIFCNCGLLINTVTGSGEIATFAEDIEGFNSIKVNNALKAEISYGTTFSVTVSIDENLREYIEVLKTGGELVMQMKPHFNFSHYTARVDVILPDLKNLSVENASSVNVSGFNASDNVSLNVADASNLSGTINCDTLALTVQEASTAKLTSTAKTMLINIRDASTAELTGSAITAELNTTDASKAKLSSLSLESVRVRLEDASSADISASIAINGSVTNASNLHYSGAASCSVTKDISSSVNHNR